MFYEFNKLVAWQKAHELALITYKVTKDFPDDELYGLTSQMRRAASSVPCNIVEGKARGSNKEFKRFLLISRGSLEELKYQYLLAKDLKYINIEQYDIIETLCATVGKLINGMINKLK